MPSYGLGLIIALLFVGLSSCSSFIGVQDAESGTDVFIGIPYALHPIRLQAPEALSGDQGVINASNPISNRCFEGGPSSSPFLGSEDCLTLDIVRPASSSNQLKHRSSSVVVSTNSVPLQNKKLLPVYVFIHGYVHIHHC